MPSAHTKAKQWIEQEKDPRSAHWQAGLESILELFAPDLDKGRITPVRPLADREVPLFNQTLKTVDIHPDLYAAFLPASVASAVVPPDSAEDIQRIDRQKPACKIILLHPGKPDRILAAEISDQAHRPGIDIFQEGALLGSYDYENTQDCLDGLNKAVKAHAWKKDTWTQTDTQIYTLNWYDRVQYLNKSDISLDTDHSFFHSPTLIKGSRVDALFHLIYLLLSRQFTGPDFLTQNLALAQKIKEKDIPFCRAAAREHVLSQLNFIKEMALMDFASYSDSENQAFETEFTRTEERLRALLIHLKPRG